VDGLQLLLQLKCTEGGLGSHLVNVLFKKNVRELMSWGHITHTEFVWRKNVICGVGVCGGGNLVCLSGWIV
jgi:hypothetical protein